MSFFVAYHIERYDTSYQACFSPWLCTLWHPVLMFMLSLDVFVYASNAENVSIRLFDYPNRIVSYTTLSYIIVMLYVDPERKPRCTCMKYRVGTGSFFRSSVSYLT